MKTRFTVIHLYNVLIRFFCCFVTGLSVKGTTTPLAEIRKTNIKETVDTTAKKIPEKALDKIPDNKEQSDHVEIIDKSPDAKSKAVKTDIIESKSVDKPQTSEGVKKDKIVSKTVEQQEILVHGKTDAILTKSVDKSAIYVESPVTRAKKTLGSTITKSARTADTPRKIESKSPESRFAKSKHMFESPKVTKTEKKFEIPVKKLTHSFGTPSLTKTEKSLVPPKIRTGSAGNFAKNKFENIKSEPSVVTKSKSIDLPVIGYDRKIKPTSSIDQEVVVKSDEIPVISTVKVESVELEPAVEAKIDQRVNVVSDKLLDNTQDVETSSVIREPLISSELLISPSDLLISSSDLLISSSDLLISSSDLLISSSDPLISLPEPLAETVLTSKPLIISSGSSVEVQLPCEEVIGGAHETQDTSKVGTVVELSEVNSKYGCICPSSPNLPIVAHT